MKLSKKKRKSNISNICQSLQQPRKGNGQYVFCLNLALQLLIRILYSEWIMALLVILSEDNCAKITLTSDPNKGKFGNKEGEGT